MLNACWGKIEYKFHLFISRALGFYRWYFLYQDILKREIYGKKWKIAMLVFLTGIQDFFRDRKNTEVRSKSKINLSTPQPARRAWPSVCGRAAGTWFLK